jgi:S-adenosylmethionine:tRNA ribosyltransferase-isomerase
MLTSDFDFILPENLIAQQPFPTKEQTPMLVFSQEQIIDQKVINLIDFLQAGDCLVFNDARVIKAKLQGKILRNNAILDFNLDQEKNGVWQALCRPAKKVEADDIIEIATDFSARILEKTNDGFIKIKFNLENLQLLEALEKYGSTPLPPYIKRTQKEAGDQKNYQTIYAKNGVAVAAPTAGLHFNENIFALLDAKKINKAFVTLNVGAGTFLPVRADKINDHKMHSEFFTIDEKNAKIINEAKKAGKRIIAVGTTALRALESAANENGEINSTQSDTEIFIFPGYKFKIVNGLMTNFHLPKSTLFMLICAFVGRENGFKIYDHAVKNNYRFYSYGDSSLLFRKSE